MTSFKKIHILLNFLTYEEIFIIFLIAHLFLNPFMISFWEILKYSDCFLHKKLCGFNYCNLQGSYFKNSWFGNLSVIKVALSIYYYHCNEKLLHGSTVILSNWLSHHTAAVHISQKLIINELRNKCAIKEIVYFIDGVKHQCCCSLLHIEKEIVSGCIFQTGSSTS